MGVLQRVQELQSAVEVGRTCLTRNDRKNLQQPEAEHLKKLIQQCLERNAWLVNCLAINGLPHDGALGGDKCSGKHDPNKRERSKKLRQVLVTSTKRAYVKREKTKKSPPERREHVVLCLQEGHLPQ